MFRAISTIGRSSLTSFWTLFGVLVCLHQLYYGWFLLRSSFVPYVMDGNESFSVWWHAHNLYAYAFWKSFGLTDESFSLNASAHPFFHTHQGNMPRLFGYLIYALGARTIEAQVLITTLVIGNLTLFFCYASIARITRPAIAFLFCLFLFSDYLLYAQWHVVTYRVWYGFLFFGTLFAILSANPPGRIWPHLLLGFLFFLLLYFELVFAAYISVLCGIFVVWQYWGRPGKIASLYVAQCIGGTAALVLLFLQLKAALGLDVMLKDFSVTFLARNASAINDDGAHLVDFFHDHNIVFWQNFRDGAALRTFSGFVRSLSAFVFQIWTPALFVMVAAPFLGIVVAFVERRPAGLRRTRFEPEKAGLPRFEPVAVSHPVLVGITVAEGNQTVWSRQFNLPRLGVSAHGRSWGFVWCASLLGLISGISLVVPLIIRSGQLFSVAPAGFVAGMPTAIATMALAASLIGLLAAHFGFAPAIAAIRKVTSGYIIVAIILVASLIMTGVVWSPGRLPLQAMGSILSSNLAALAVSAAGLLLGYLLRATSLLAVSRATLVCSLVAVFIAKSSLLYDQNYQDIWLALVQDWKIRLLIRLAAAITIGAGVAFALWGARRSFGRSQKTAIGHGLIFFFLGLFSYAVIYVLSPGYVISGYAERLAPFAIFFLVSIPALAISGILVTVRRSGAWPFRDGKEPSQKWGLGIVPSGAILAVAVIFLFWAKVQIYYARMFPSDHVAFAKTLSSPPFRHASFGVDNYAAVVAYYSGAWAYMDMTLGSATPDPKNPLDEHLKDNTGLWFADWKSNRDYASPTYYVCMKPQNFDSALALRDPVRFGSRFAFCDSEPIVNGRSDFDDKTLASDGPVPRFWAVVKPGVVPPRIVGIDASLARETDKWTIDYKPEVIAVPAGTSPAIKVELDTLPGATSCKATLGEMNSVDARTDGSGFELSTDFVGLISVRARVSPESKKFGWTQDRWIVGGQDDPSAALSHCPQTIIDTSFAEDGQALRSQGWSTPDPWGTWSIGGLATLTPIEVRESQLNSDFIFEADVRSFVPSPDHPQRVRMLANGVEVADWLFTPSNYDERKVRALIPNNLLAGDHKLRISFETPDAVSPASQGPSIDIRKLGLGVRWLKIEAWSPSSASHAHTEISFREAEDNGSYLAAGWLLSGEGAVAQDPTASLLLPVPKGTLAHPIIAIDASVVKQNGPVPVIDVFVNKKVIGQVSAAEKAATFSFDLPGGTSANDTLLIEFKERKSLGLAPDSANLNEPLPLLLRNIRVDWNRR